MMGNALIGCFEEIEVAVNRLMKAVALGALLVASCASPPTPVPLETSTLQLSLGGLFPSDRQLQYLVPGTRARVTVAGVGLETPLVQVAPVSGETSLVTLSGVPKGPNRVVTIETLDETEQPIPGGRFRTTLDVMEGPNTAALSAASTVRGDVYDALLIAKSGLAGTLDELQVQAKIDEVKRMQRVGHYGLIDGGAIAGLLRQNGGRIDLLDAADPAVVQAPTTLRIEVKGLPSNLQASVWVNDAVSPKQSGLSNGTLDIQPTKPGAWQLYGRAGTFRLGPVPVDLTTSARATLDFSRAELLSQALPQPRGGAASGVLSIGGRDVLVVAGGTIAAQGRNVSTDSVLVFNGTAWSAKAPMPDAVSHAAFVASGNKLYVLGGYGPDGMSRAVQVYDGATNSWSTTLPLLKYRTFLGAAACIGNTLYMTSGYANAGEFYGADWSIYKLPLDGSATQWQEFGLNDGDPQLRYARQGSAVAAVGSKLYVFGGTHDDFTLMHRVEAYDTLKGTMRELAPMPTARHGAFTWVKGGKVYVMGGITALGKALATVEVYDVATDTWSVSPQLREPRGHAAVGELGGKCVIAGGNDGHYVAQDVSVLSSVESLAF